MSTAQTSSTETLYHQWRKGDAAAGQAMAQRFTDWYFAIAASRLGEDAGEGAFREACTQFSRGVGKVGDARRLLGWAHTIARKQIEGVIPQGRLHDGDLPNAFTRKQSPKDLLVRVREHLPAEMGLLETAYGGQPVADAQALLRARYRVKAWLRQTWDVPFRVTPERPDPDRAPLPFYEAGRMADEQEETYFELFMLHDMEVCQDVAEFAHYAIALRGGLPGEPPSVQPQRRSSASEAPRDVDAPRSAPQAVVRPPVAAPVAARSVAAEGLPTPVKAAIVMAGGLVLVAAILGALSIFSS